MNLHDYQAELMREVVTNASRHSSFEYLHWIDDESTILRLGMDYERYCQHREELAAKANELVELRDVVCDSLRSAQGEGL